MIVSVEPGGDAALVHRELVKRGLWAQRMEGGARVFFLVEQHSQHVPSTELRAIPHVETVAEPGSGHPRVDHQRGGVEVAGITVGGGHPAVWIAGPCCVDSRDQLMESARALARIGTAFLRGGAFKPRSSPYSFQGRGLEALGWLRDAANASGLGVVTEAMSPEEVPPVAEVADLVQVGSRNMHNYALLKAVGRANRPVLLKRGMAATVEEWLLAAEYCLAHGAPGVIFCERGLRGFDPNTRNLLDFGAVALLAHVHGLPVVVDPSHGVGRRDLVAPLARAAVAVGAAGVMIETHPDPGTALSDGPQALAVDDLRELIPPSRPPYLAEVHHG